MLGATYYNLAMKYTILQIFLFLNLYCLGQKVVNNQAPHVATDFKKYLYVNYDNPIYITTGSIKSLKVSTDNGAITETNKKGAYLIKPEKTGTTIITLSGQNYKKDFIFQTYPMQYPSIRLIGVPNEDGMIKIKESDGIWAYHNPSDVDISYQIDSFTVEVKDSIGSSKHVNIGTNWDSVTKQMIKDAKSGSRILIYGVYMSRQGRKLHSDGYLESYVW